MEFKKLTEKQLEEAKKCTTEEEKKAFLKKQKINLPDDVLESTVGGDSTEDGLKCTRCGKRLIPTQMS